MAGTKKFQVDIATNPSCILITAEPIASHAAEAIPINSIVNVVPQFFDYTGVENNDSGDNFKETYPYPKMTTITIELMNGDKVSLELQSITNQATWNLGTLAALQAASVAINALL